ncbi:hypothetical protein VTN77DRAFT_7352 [Rasamsonia byssochlamydoides]|uniref:uncharacterized protein n=1 Tax=Rasamsonia byssochlamydoides TaxID=89139 RepID=UPI003743E226
MTLTIDAMAEVEQLSRDLRRGCDPTSDSNLQGSELINGSPKKRKRSRKAQPDKKFECKHEGCGKSYSRAEHLHRHQLNHTPKQIYRCDFPDCYRSFVRQDLCIRHRERHTTHGSQLQKRDNFALAASNLAAVSRPPPAPPRDESISARSTAAVVSPPSTSRQNPMPFESTNVSHPSTVAGLYNATSGPTLPAEGVYQPLTPQTGYGSSDAGVKQSDSGSSYTLSPSQAQSGPTYASAKLPTTYGPLETSNYHGAPFGAGELGRSPTTANPGSAAAYSALPMSTLPQSTLPQSTLPQSGYSTSSLHREASVPYATAGLTALDTVSGGIVPTSTGDAGLDSTKSYPYPVFGGETYNRSPFAMADDFTAWLFNDPGTGSSPVNYSAMVPPGYSDPSQVQTQFFANDLTYGSYFTNVVPQHHPMSVTSILDSAPPEAMMSEEKRQDILHLISTRFNEAEHSAVHTRKEALMEGDIDADDHVLSLRMMQTYVGSYWLHFHAQLPILHKPTFVTDKTPTLLLLAVMAIGAATLEKVHGHSLTEAAAGLANFLAWHIRWEIFMDVDFRPPAKLWVFQTLLLLEVYEKMYSTRALHERAHIHHDTTLTLMRRGSSLIGRSAFDSPASFREGRSTTSDSGDDSWAHWIKTEATRRVAFGAFVMDSIHATMFGHSAKMVAHEMRLPLPCDEALWSATSAAEVARMQASLQSNGVKPIMFLDALKKTLTGQKVRTNAFGRTIIMAGLLSVSWHMNQRDLQVSSLGVVQALGGRDKWRSALLRAFDNWKRDFDEALADSGPRAYPNLFQQQYPVDEDATFESSTVLHHLAHMASHVDIVDCQIFAGAGRLLGRSITPKDYSTAREKMTEHWASKASARDATYYALKFLSQVLLPTDNGPLGPDGQPVIRAPGYSAREDFLLNRSWVVYFAALVVWSYGYALEGPIPSPPELNTVADQIRDMQQFLGTVGAVREPNDLEHITGRNRCMGLLMILRDSFQNTRWELLREAANLLDSCIGKLKSPLQR